jgi:anthranilate synthase/aminodeoxychorismate synthase-like glutamine amidotransferase
MSTLLIDNYDSFTFNLCQYLAELRANPVVFKNDKISLNDIKKMNPDRIVISAGPGTVTNRNDFGICQEIITEFGQHTPILGVCLGHQGIARTFGGKIIHAPKVMHGKQSQIEHKGIGIFKGIPNPFTAMRYHSLSVDPESLPVEIVVTATVKGENTIMALQHSVWPIYGIQFHPESFGTPEGKNILKNFIHA